jgi:6-phosphogluconolactonase
VSERRVRHFTDTEQWLECGACAVVEAARAAVAARGRFTLVLSGGRTPRPVYERLAASPAMPWSATWLFWGDERWVAGDDERSNRGTALAALAGAGVPAEQIIAVPTETASPEEAAEAYEARLRRYFAEAGGEPGVFDVVLLGMGADGHTASLFPGEAAVREAARWVRAVPKPGLEPWVPRVTMTLPLLSRGRRVIFLVAGAGKAGIVAEMASDPAGAAERYPAARVGAGGELLWLVLTDAGA